MDIWNSKVGDEDVHLAPEEDKKYEDFAAAIILLKEKIDVFESFVRGYHAYMDIWNPKVDEEDVHLAPEEDNKHDDFAAAIFFSC